MHGGALSTTQSRASYLSLCSTSAALFKRLFTFFADSFARVPMVSPDARVDA